MLLPEACVTLQTGHQAGLLNRTAKSLTAIFGSFELKQPDLQPVHKRGLTFTTAFVESIRAAGQAAYAGEERANVAVAACKPFW